VYSSRDDAYIIFCLAEKNVSHVSLISNCFLQLIKTLLLMCQMQNRCLAIENFRKIALTKTLLQFVTIIVDVTNSLFS
jgi:hypothetical protein